MVCVRDGHFLRIQSERLYCDDCIPPVHFQISAAFDAWVHTPDLSWGFYRVLPDLSGIEFGREELVNLANDTLTPTTRHHARSCGARLAGVGQSCGSE